MKADEYKARLEMLDSQIAHLQAERETTWKQYSTAAYKRHLYLENTPHGLSRLGVPNKSGAGRPRKVQG